MRAPRRRGAAYLLPGQNGESRYRRAQSDGHCKIAGCPEGKVGEQWGAVVSISRKKKLGWRLDEAARDLFGRESRNWDERSQSSASPSHRPSRASPTISYFLSNTRVGETVKHWRCAEVKCKDTMRTLPSQLDEAMQSPCTAHCGQPQLVYGILLRRYYYYLYSSYIIFEQ